MLKKVQYVDLISDGNSYHCPEWHNLGIKHNFFDRKYNFNLASRSDTRVKFVREQYLNDLILLNQNHTDHFLEFNQSELSSLSKSEWLTPADALIVKDINSFTNIGLGVMTADCLPILIYSPRIVAVIHSGWQGLQIKITNKVLRRLEQLGVTDPKILIGPHAGPANYQFGDSELKLLGKEAVFESRSGHNYLNMAETLSNQIDSVNYQLLSTSICTIEDSRFHSYRRDAELSGRNLSLLVI